MPEYIDRDALRQAVLKSQYDNPHPLGAAYIAHDREHEHFVAIIDRFPVADVAPVVRCKDCQNCQEMHGVSGVLLCMNHLGTVLPDDFCSYGKGLEG